MTMDVEGQRGDADKVLRLRRRRPETCSDLYYEPKNTVQVFNSSLKGKKKNNKH
ncbi:hypothetical protein F2Q69_00037457 [Brassica cretica]|uniref:Uncharacterized protein n=1 Tax=Brassica cretica TaxID=69181 RepID=A0A8S9SFJ8_BRACR|nr:hypothetical protein F2Q69_00037457 [Brassica cretica]